MRKRNKLIFVLSSVILFTVLHIIIQALSDHGQPRKAFLTLENKVVRSKKANASPDRELPQSLLGPIPRHSVKQTVIKQQSLQMSNSNNRTVRLKSDLSDSNLVLTTLCAENVLGDCSDSRSAERSRIMVAMPTPRDFMEIPKLSPKKTRRRGSGATYQSPEKAFPRDNPKSPTSLMKMALRSSKDSDVGEFLDVQKKRRALVENRCKDMLDNDSQLDGIQHTFQNIIIDRVDFLSFCPIFKAASTSWSIIMLEMMKIWKETKRPKIQRIIDVTFQRVSNVIAPSVTKDTTKFIIVRHPFDRLISCYRDKFEYARKSYYYFMYGEKIVRLFRPAPPGASTEEVKLMLEAVRKRLETGGLVFLPGNPYAKPVGPTFEEFIKYVIYGKYDDEHWRPYYVHCAVCHMDYDVILRFENLLRDSQLFLAYLQRRDLKVRWENSNQDGTTTREIVCQYLSKISKKLLMKVIEKYKEDFELFDYGYSEYIQCAKDHKKL